MHPLRYHSGQLEVQAEANTRHVADKLAGWVGPAGEYAAGADLVLFSYLDEPQGATGSPAGSPAAGGASLRFAAISGQPPLVMATGPGVLQLPSGANGALPAGALLGGLVIALERAERARINGSTTLRDGHLELAADEAFTLCRKYMAPSEAIETGLLVGPAGREPIAVDDPWTNAVVGTTETAFLASLAPDGAPDVAHRGGPAGFLRLDADRGVIAWSELVGDGVFKSAGNLRATGTASLLALDIASGDGLEITGIARYENTRTRFTPREDPLVRMPQPFPQQGRVELEIRALARLRRLTHPRLRLQARRITSRDAPDEQAPR